MQATKKGIPPGARWTKIDRRLVNPEALEEAKERFEERADCVIVLRVLTKEDIQKFADKTKIIRGMRRHYLTTTTHHDDSYARPYLRRCASDFTTRSEASTTSISTQTPPQRSRRRPTRPQRRRAHSNPITTTDIILDVLAAAFPTLIPSTLANHPPRTDKREAEMREQEERSSRISSRHRSRDDRNRDRRERDEYEDENSEDEFKPRAPRMLALPGVDASAGGEQADFRERRGERDRERDREREGSYVSANSRRRDDRETEY